MLEQLQRLQFLVGRRHRSRWLALVAIAVLVSVMEMLGALLVFGLFGLLINRGSSVDVPLLTNLFSAEEIDASSDTFLIWAAIIVAAFFVLRGGLFLFQTYAQNRILHNAGVRLASRLLDGYLNMPYAFHLRRNSSELIRNTYTSTLEIVTSFFLPIVLIASQTFVVVGVALAMVLASPIATALALVLIAPTLGILLRFVQPRMQDLGATTHQMSSTAIKSLQESLQGVRDVKLAAKENFFVSRFVKARALQARSYYLRTVLWEIPRVLMEVTLVVFVVLFLLVTSRMETQPDETVAVLGLVGYAGLRLLPSLGRIVTSMNELRFNTPALDDILQELRAMERATTAANSATPMPLTQTIEVKNVSFAYEGENADLVLHDVCLSIPKGAFIGIIGGTGSGKSTLMDILIGLLTPSHGSVTVDGRPVVQNIRGWQGNLGVVPQAPFMLDGTVRENIAFGQEAEHIDDERLGMTIQIAQLQDFVATLPDGLDTEIGERGLRISGGERQRLAVARALYRDPDVLFFDEATSSLDNRTEAQLIEAMLRRRQDQTLVMIAHRLTSLEGSDRIYVLENGRITDSGTFTALHERNALFAQLQNSSPKEVED